MAQALVAIRPVEGPEFMVASGTKADGRFGLYRVPPGRYHLTASAEGFLPLADEVEVAAGELLDDLELRLQPAAGAEIQVRLASGQVPEFVHLLVHDPAGAVGVDMPAEGVPLAIGKGRKVRSGDDIAVLTDADAALPEHG